MLLLSETPASLSNTRHRNKHNQAMSMHTAPRMSIRNEPPTVRMESEHLNTRIRPRELVSLSPCLHSCGNVRLVEQTFLTRDAIRTVGLVLEMACCLYSPNYTYLKFECVRKSCLGPLQAFHAAIVLERECDRRHLLRLQGSVVKYSTRRYKLPVHSYSAI